MKVTGYIRYNITCAEISWAARVFGVYGWFCADLLGARRFVPEEFVIGVLDYYFAVGVLRVYFGLGTNFWDEKSRIHFA